MKMMKVAFPVLVSLLVLFGIGRQFFQEEETTLTPVMSSEKEDVSETIITSSSEKEEPKIEQKAGSNQQKEQPAKEIKVPYEIQFMQDIHKMTHQKVYAEEKWGALEITPDRIDEMLAILEEADYDHHSFYYQTLTAWKNNDFSNAVDVHNQIWRWQDGTLGKALRMLTAEEEQEYIEKNFQ